MKATKVWICPVAWNGSDLIFNQVLFPIFKEHHEQVEEQAEKAKVSIRRRKRGGLSITTKKYSEVNDIKCHDLVQYTSLFSKCAQTVTNG